MLQIVNVRMRFRAKLLNIVCITQLSNVVSTLAKAVKTCVLRLSPTKVCFILSDRIPVGGANLWCELLQHNVFNEFRIEGKDDRNEIYLEVTMDLLSRALKSSLNASMLKIKLTNKNGACLTLETTQTTLTGAQRNVTHDVPVTVVPERLWMEYQEPVMPDIDVSIYLPPLKLFRNVVDRMKAMSNYVTIAANLCGDLRIGLETDKVSVTTFFKDLQNHHFQDTLVTPADPDTLAIYEARVDVKKFCQFLQGQFNPTKAICNIVGDQGVQLFLLHEVVSLQYYIPATSR